MKAQVLHEIGQDFLWDTIPEPIPSDDQYIIKIKNASINHRDLWIRNGQYAKIKLPAVLGSDASGYLNGKEVIINPSLNWGSDENFQSNEFNLLGMPRQGSFAEYILASKHTVFDKPKHLTSAQAAALPVAGTTAYRVLHKRIFLNEHDKILITGIGGGVASLAMQFALALGHEVFVTSSSDEKIKRSIEMGAQGGFNYRSNGWVDHARKEGFDFIIDGSGGETMNQLIKICKPGGSIGIYGAGQGPVSSLSLQPVFWKQLNIFGSTMGSDEDFREMISFVEIHKIIPLVDKIFPLEELNQAMSYFASGSHFGKIIMDIP